MKNFKLIPVDTYKLPSEIPTSFDPKRFVDLSEVKKALSTFIKKINRQIFLNNISIVIAKPGLGVLESLKENPFFKKACVVSCQHLCVATILSLREDSVETVFIFDEFERVPEKAKDALLRFISERKSIVLCRDQNFLLPVWFVDKCVTIEV